MFVRAVQAGDGAALRATLGAGATLSDESREYRGDAIDGWLKGLPQSRMKTIRPINEAKRAGETVLTILTNERDANGRDLDLEWNWHFRIKADRIVAVRIARRPTPTLPPAVAAYVRATNNFDLEELLATFADDALVNDQLCDFWGKEAIREWAAREVIGVELTMHVVKVVEHYGHVIVTAYINGSFDWRGLPDPLVLAFYFSAPGDRIVQLIILRKQCDT
jgi:hypothetical protein